MRDDDTCVEDLCSLHSAVGLSQINSALGPGTSNKNILPRRGSGLGFTPPSDPLCRVSRDERGRIFVVGREFNKNHPCTLAERGVRRKWRVS